MKQLDIRGTEDSNADSAPDFLSLFLNDDFWNLLTVETNLYAHKFLASHEIKPHSKFHQWYKADDHPDYGLIEPCLKAAVRQNTGVGSVVWVFVWYHAMRGIIP